jgi:tripartite-type tricarboxylate transporter receptor subunit TctC
MSRPDSLRYARRLTVGAVCAGVAAVVAAPAAGAESYPTRPVKLVVPFPGGGGPLDYTARLIAAKLAAALKQPFVVENRPGASGQLGTELVAKATPDGHTLLFVLETPLTVSPSLYPKLAYDPVRDFTPIAAAGRFSQMLAVNPSVPVNSLADFVAYAKERKERPVVYGSGGGRGDPGHLTMEYFRSRAGFEGVHVPYKGNAEIVMNLVGGQIEAGFIATPGVLPHVQSGRLKALAISSTERAPLAPDTPTVAESGFPGFEVGFMEVMLAPAGLPEPIRIVLEREVRDALQAPDVQARLRAAAIEPFFASGADTAVLLRNAAERWRNVIMSANIRIE